jgi:hypothetical protein
MAIVPFYRSIDFVSVHDCLQFFCPLMAAASRVDAIATAALSKRRLFPVFLLHTVALPGLPAGQSLSLGCTSRASRRAIRQQRVSNCHGF